MSQSMSCLFSFGEITTRRDRLVGCRGGGERISATRTSDKLRLLWLNHRARESTTEEFQAHCCNECDKRSKVQHSRYGSFDEFRLLQYLEYFLVESSKYFEIDPSSGQLSCPALDREEQSEHLLVVIVQDGDRKVGDLSLVRIIPDYGACF